MTWKSPYRKIVYASFLYGNWERSKKRRHSGSKSESSNGQKRLEQRPESTKKVPCNKIFNVDQTNEKIYDEVAAKDRESIQSERNP